MNDGALLSDLARITRADRRLQTVAKGASWPRRVAAMDEELDLHFDTHQFPVTCWDPSNVHQLREQLAEDGFLFLPNLVSLDLSSTSVEYQSDQSVLLLYSSRLSWS